MGNILIWFKGKVIGIISYRNIDVKYILLWFWLNYEIFKKLFNNINVVLFEFFLEIMCNFL